MPFPEISKCGLSLFALKVTTVKGFSSDFALFKKSILVEIQLLIQPLTRYYLGRYKVTNKVQDLGDDIGTIK